MVLWIGQQGPLAEAAEAAMAGAETPFASTTPDDDDLFTKALGKKGVVYTPASRLLDGLLDPSPDPMRAQAAVGACRAPGVEVIVMVAPRTEAYALEEQVLKREGRPYVILRAPILIEEAAEVLRREPRRSVWLPRTGSVVATSVAAVIDAIVNALHTDEQGRVIDVPGETMSVAELFQRAASLPGGSRVKAVSPFLHKLARPLARAVLGPEPAALRLADRLIAAQ